MENRIEELERELKETGEQLALTREQLRLQSRRARQLVAACSTKVEEKEREMRMLRVLKDGQLQSIVRKLLHFESLLRQEQKRVVEIVRQKDQIIWTQSTELDQLRQANRKLLMAASQDPDDSSSVSNPAASKMAKLDPENKENVEQNESQTKTNQQQQMETPLVTKMVRRFEPAPSTVASKKTRNPKETSPSVGGCRPDPGRCHPATRDGEQGRRAHRLRQRSRLLHVGKEKTCSYERHADARPSNRTPAKSVSPRSARSRSRRG